MLSLTQLPSTTPLLHFPRSHHKRPNISFKPQTLHTRSNFKRLSANTSQWEPAPVTYASDDEGTSRKETSKNIFENLNSSSNKQAEEASIIKTEPHVNANHFRTPLWLFGPLLLLLTGVVPTLWLPVSSFFLGPNIATLLSLTGLDCIFNLGASLFLLMADSTARLDGPRDCASEAPSGYRFWNVFANVTGFIIPILAFLGSRRGLFFLQPQLSFISFAVLLGPYFLLLSVQLLTEILTWHWRSPVWLVTPVVYEAYRLVQLMRGLSLSDELGAPAWTVHTVRGLVCLWVLVLGVQLMRVAWYAGFTAFSYEKRSDDSDDDY